MLWVYTRKFHVFALFIAFILAAGFCFVQGYITNPYLPKLPAPKPTSFQWEIGEKEFILPNVLHAGITNRLAVWCNVSSYNLAVGSPTSVVVVDEVLTYVYEVLSIEVTVRDALRVSPIPFENYPLMEPLTPSRFSLYSKGSSRSTFFPFESQIYSGDDLVEFQAAGSIELTITITLLPPSEVYSVQTLYEEFQSMFPDNRYTIEIPMTSIIIESGTTAQQQASNNLNLSLTYFVLFFASTDIAVALHDHSENKDKKTEYDEEKAEKKRLKLSEQNQDVI